MKERIYVVGGPTGIYLINAPSKQTAIAYVANSQYNAHVASQQDLVELLGKGVQVEHARAANMELELGEQA